jgi:hypothetical protein
MRAANLAPRVRRTHIDKELHRYDRATAYRFDDLPPAIG